MKQTGIASIYYGGRTASGERTKASSWTAAHKTLPFGTKVTIRNDRSGRAVHNVKIDDRGPFVRGRIIDVTPAVARALGFSGLVRVTIST